MLRYEPLITKLYHCATAADLERAVDAWVLGPPPIPTASRHLASLGLRILFALDSARSLVDTGPLESAARNAVESAFTTVSAAR
jgi:hypothetical protein